MGLVSSAFECKLKSLIDPNPNLELTSEQIPYNKRKACIRYAKWVQAAGGRVKGWKNKLEEEAMIKRKAEIQAKRAQLQQRKMTTLSDTTNIHNSQIDLITSPEHSVIDIGALSNSQTSNDGNLTTKTDENNLVEIWPLQLLELNDPDQMDLVYLLLSKCAVVISYYLTECLFPPLMRHQGMKLTANGQVLGGSMLFSRRLGFSGTPSDLLPIELGKCQYEKGSDGKMINYLTNSQIVNTHLLTETWTVHSLLITIANAQPHFNALIDTGALITGMTNEEVARFLLTHGSPTIEGVVYLDSTDSKKILVRSTMKSMSLSQCGISLEKRFSFYDQIHTTGMDIHHTLNARAVITLGKDMVFRDYAQGAFRMRGIGQGQTLAVYIIPEIQRLIQTHLESARTGKPIEHIRQENEVKAIEQVKNKTSDTESDLLLSSNSISIVSSVSLVDVVAWLIINSMRSERIQFNMLCEQSVENVWRNRAHFVLLNNWKTIGLSQSLQQHNELVEQCVDVFRDRLDFAVENTVPKTIPFAEKLQKLISQHTHLIKDSKDQSDIKQVLAWVSVSNLKQQQIIEIEHQNQSEEEHMFGGEQVQQQGQSNALENWLRCFKQLFVLNLSSTKLDYFRCLNDVHFFLIFGFAEQEQEQGQWKSNFKYQTIGLACRTQIHRLIHSHLLFSVYLFLLKFRTRTRTGTR